MSPYGQALLVLREGSESSGSVQTKANFKALGTMAWGSGNEKTNRDRCPPSREVGQNLGSRGRVVPTYTSLGESSQAGPGEEDHCVGEAGLVGQ